MRKRILPFLFSSAFAALLFGRDLDTGGVQSIDIFQASRNRLTETAQAQDLFPQDSVQWDFSAGMQGRTEDTGELSKKASRLVTRSKEMTSGGKLSFVMETPLSINEFRDAKSGEPRFWHRFTTKTKIPVQADSKYRLKFLLKYRVYNSPGRNGLYTFITFLKEDGQTRVREDQVGWNPVTQTQEKTELAVFVPPETAFLQISFNMCGCGRTEVSDISLRQTEKAPGFDVAIHPMGAMDNEVHIMRNEPLALSFPGSNETSVVPVDPWLKLTLPPGFHVAEVSYGAVWKKADGKTNTWLVRMRNEKNWKADPDPSYPTGVIIMTDLEPSDKTYTASYQGVSDGYATPLKTFSLKVIPACEGKRPRFFLSGIMATRDIAHQPKTETAFADLYRKLGFNCIYMHPWDKRLSALLKERNILRLGAGLFGNGFMGGPAADERPEYTHFKDMNGKVLLPYAYCPSSIYNRTEYYRDVKLPQIRKTLAEEDLYDLTINNWEPPGALSFGGCFCENCKKDFIRHSQLEPEKVDAVWPAKVTSAAGNGSRSKPGSMADSSPCWKKISKKSSRDPASFRKSSAATCGTRNTISPTRKIPSARPNTSRSWNGSIPGVPISTIPGGIRRCRLRATASAL